MRNLAYALIIILCADVMFAVLMTATTIGRERQAWAVTAFIVGIPAVALGIIWLLQERKQP